MEGAPPQYTAKTMDDYLEHMSKPVFQAGISWRVVESKWPTTKTAFHRFHIARVARMSDREIDAMAKDERVIRSRPKIAAVVHNAGEIMAIERAAGFKKYLRSFDDYAALEKDLRKRFKFLGPSGIYHFLWSVKQPVPEWHTWARSAAYCRGREARRRPPVAGDAARTRSALVGFEDGRASDHHAEPFSARTTPQARTAPSPSPRPSRGGRHAAAESRAVDRRASTKDLGR